MSDIPHLCFILGAYGITALVLIGTVLAIMLDGRTQRRLLDSLDRDGFKSGRPR